MNEYIKNLYDLEAKNVFYLKRYDKFIESRQKRILEQNTKREIHHIQPLSLNGNNSFENLITLSYREHYICHWILWKAFGGPMTRAFWLMRHTQKDRNIKNGSKTYSLLKEEFIVNNSGENASFYGKTHTEETRKILSESKKGTLNPMFGKEGANKGIPMKEETKNKLKEYKGEKSSFYGKTHTEETRKILSEKRMGSLNPMFGKESARKGVILSDEIKGKISQKLKGIPISEERKKKSKENRKPTSEDTKIKMSIKIKNKIWINNGIENKRIDKELTIPENWKRGRFR